MPARYDAKKIEGKKLDKMYFPFESELIWRTEDQGASPINYLVYAKGKGIPSQKANGLAVYEKIANYELWLRRNQNGEDNIDLLVFKADLNTWQDTYQGGAWIYWVGDLNGDGIPEIIFKTAETYKGWDYQMLLSDPSSGDQLYKIIKVGGGSTC